MPIDIKRAREQHRTYENALKSEGYELVSLPALPELPDSVFVEGKPAKFPASFADTAIVLDECAVLTRPGSPSRRPEVERILPTLKSFRSLFSIKEPACLDGGDVLRVGKTLYIGISGRSNIEAVYQLQALLLPFGYSVIPVEVTGCLHLKTAVTQVKENTLLLNPDWVEKKNFPGKDFIEVDPSEPFAANAVLLNSQKIIYSNTHPRTQRKLEEAGIKLVLVPADELAKAEGGVTCCSILFNKQDE